MRKQRVREQFIQLAKEQGLPATFSRQQLLAFVERNKDTIKFPYWLVNNPKNVITRGFYRLPTDDEESPVSFTLDPIPVVTAKVSHHGHEALVPSADPLFVPYGHFEDIKKILGSRQFIPFTITGPTGNGKTVFITQACAQLQRPMVRLNMTSSTDEEKIIGSFRIINGETVFHKGPAIVAMEKGAVLLIDEFDLGDPERIMCLQSICEGSGYFIKETGEYIQPQPGFTIAATSNTKGTGSETGEYIGTQILNEAFLERFDITFEQSYATKTVEKNILTKVMKLHLSEKIDSKDTTYIDNLVTWATQIRKVYEEGGLPHSMSTRRLVKIVKAYTLFKDRKKAIELCTNRFDYVTKKSMLETYEKIDAEEEKKLQAQPEDLKTPATPASGVTGSTTSSTTTTASMGPDDVPWGQ